MKNFLCWILIIGFSAQTYGSGVKNRITIKKSTELVIDDSDGEELSQEKTELLQTKRRGLIEEIKRFLRESKSENQRLQLSLRLGTLYIEDYRATNAIAQSQQGTPRKASETLAKKSLERAMSIYKTLIAKYPDHGKKDEILYALAVASLDKGQTTGAMHYFQQIANQGSSKYAADAYLELGDYFFERNDYPKAQKNYDRIIRLKDRRLIPYAAYKKAWCLYNQEDFAQSIKHFRWVTKLESMDANIRVKNEAIRDIALPFVASRNIAEALNFYSGMEPVAARKGLELMANMLLEKGAYPESLRLYTTLLEMDPNWKDNPTYDLGMFEALSLKGQRNDAIEHLFSRIPVYSDGSTWYDLNSDNPKLVTEMRDRFEESARKYAIQFHAEGQKTKNDQLYEVAKNLYAKYLEYFQGTTHSAKIRFYLAEIFFHQNKFKEAANQYYAVYEYKGAGSLRLDAIRYSLAALDRQITAERKSLGLTAIHSRSTAKIKNEDGKVIPLSESEERLLKMGTEYTAQFPAEKDVPDVLYTQAYLRYSHNQLREAKTDFWNLIQRYPKHTFAPAAAYLVLDILNQQAQYTELATVCHQLLQHRDLQKPQLKYEIAGLLRQTELKRIALLEETREYKKAAEQYIEYTKAYGREDERLFETALFNAGVNYTKAGMILEASDTQEHFLRRFTKSPLRESTILGVARSFESLALLKKSAFYYELFATEFPNHSQAKHALRLSALFYWGASHHRKAESLLESYRKLYNLESETALSDLLAILESQGLTTREIEFLLRERSIKKIPALKYMRLSLKILDLQRASGHPAPTITQEIQKGASLFRNELMKSPEGIEVLARAHMIRLSNLDNQFHRLHLGTKNIEHTLKIKLGLLKDLEKQYAEIAKIGSREWGLAAFYRTAFAYQQMTLEITQAPVPAELNQEQLEIYRAELKKEMIAPFIQKALGFSKLCMEKATEFSMVSRWTPRCYALASQIDDENFKSVRTFYIPSVRTALQLPTAESKTPMGDLRIYNYPFHASLLFQSNVAENTPLLPELMTNVEGYAPRSIDYRSLTDERRQIFEKLMSDSQPSSGSPMNFAYLNAMRIVNPPKASQMILKAIARDPNNTALMNLLALSHLDQGNPTHAKVLWLSLIARGERTSAVLNNLGVVSWLGNDQTSAMEYWNEAITLPLSLEASFNMGALALKCNNGFEAKKHFERALADAEKDATLTTSLGVALLQNQQYAEARDQLIMTTKKFKSDPYARLSLSYFHLDVEKRPDAAETLLSDYVQSHDDKEIQSALSETQRNLATSSASWALPMVGR